MNNPMTRWRVARVDRGAVSLLATDDIPAGQMPSGLVTVPTSREGTLPAVVGDPVVPAVGDLVLRDGDRVLVLPRTSELVRDGADRTSREQVIAANVDVVVIVEHLDPTPSLGRIERMLTIAWRSGARPVVALSKSDLVSDTTHWVSQVRQVSPGAEVVAVSAAVGTGLADLDAALAGATTLVLIGPSGAGKSTLVNALAGEPVMATADVRRDGRGMHTTAHRQLVRLRDGRVLIDTPGLRSVGLVATQDAVEATFEDIAALAVGCRFSDCAHEQEPGCAVVAAIEAGTLPERRFQSWRTLRREAHRQRMRSDARLAAEARRTWRTIERERRQAVKARGRG